MFNCLSYSFFSLCVSLSLNDTRSPSSLTQASSFYMILAPLPLTTTLSRTDIWDRELDRLEPAYYVVGFFSLEDRAFSLSSFGCFFCEESKLQASLDIFLLPSNLRRWIESLVEILVILCKFFFSRLFIASNQWLLAISNNGNLIF